MADVSTNRRKHRRVQSSLELLGFAYLSGLVLAHTACRYFVVLPAAVLILIIGFFAGSVRISPQRMVLYLGLVLTMLSAAALNSDTFARSLKFILPAAASAVVYEALSYWRPSVKAMQCWLVVMALVVVCGFTWPIFSNRNSQGPIPVFLLYLSDEFTVWNKRHRWVAVMAVAVAVALSSSRASALLLIAYLTMTIVKSRRAQLIIFAVGCLMFILTYGMGVVPIPSVLLLGRPLSYTAGRDIRWQGGLELVRRYPFGMGYASYSETLMEITGDDVLRTVHNTYLSVAVQFGLPYLALCVAVVCWLLANNHSAAARAFALAAYLHGFFESGVPFGYSLESAILILPLYLGSKLPLTRVRAKTELTSHPKEADSIAENDLPLPS